jgi:hypothetical protein
MGKIWISLLGLLMIVACGRGASGPAPAPPPIGEQAAATQARNPDEDDAFRTDAAQYAAQQGISVEEAMERLAMQDGIGTLQARLESDEAAIYAGLWIHHAPAYRVVVAFTEGGAETIQPYIEGQPYASLIELRTHRYTLQELAAAQQEASAIAEQLGLAVSSRVDVENNQVELSIGNPTLFLQDVEAAGRALHEAVVVQAINPDDLPASNRGGVTRYTAPDGSPIFFLRQAPASSFMAALLRGTLVLDANGCVRVATAGEGGYAPLVVWHHDFTLRVEGERVEVLDGAGQVIARVGELTRMGGGEVTSTHIPELPFDACPGPYWVLGDIEPLEAQHIPDIDVGPFSVDGGMRAVLLHQSAPTPEENVLEGELMVDEKLCLRVGDYAVLLPPNVWPRESGVSFFLVHSTAEGVEVRIAAVGDTIRIPGAERTPDDYRFFANKVPCAGPYWGAARVE